MATTDARTGFRLPWSTDQKHADDDVQRADAAADAAAAETGSEQTTAGPDAGTTDADATGAAGTEQEPAVHDSSTTGAAGPGSSAPPSKKQNKFLADLTRAMQSAAEAAREESISRFTAEAKSFVEQIHTRSAEESADLRRRADEDVASIRDWSKAELARIREETEQRITDRKARLEREVEQHAALIEHEIERIQGRVTEFEQEMARFFERLLAEDDPSRFAAMAENLPEPPSFDIDIALAEAATLTLPEPKPAVVADSEGAADAQVAAGHDSPATADDTARPPSDDPEATFAAIQAAAEAAEAAEVAQGAEGAGATAETEGWQAVPEAGVAESYSTDASGPGASDAGQLAEDSGGSEGDVRFAAFGLNPDSAAAAEAEAFAIDPAAAEAEEIPEIADDALAARLAGLAAAGDADGTPAATTRPTQVVVVGLVSVASIASFKRHLGRLPGVQSVGVSSGPDGEFVFAVTHGPDVVLSEVIPSVPGFQPRVTSSGEGVINVTAHDPETSS